MPNRVLRDTTDSEKVNSLTVHAERFFYRLIMKADDYGLFVADTRLLKAHCFPLLLDSVREADLSRWLAECQKAGLIVLYEESNKKYLQIIDFRQRLDKAKAKYPFPPLTNESVEVGTEFPSETETETEVEKETLQQLDKPTGEQAVYKTIEKTKKGIHDYIKTVKPKIIEPYKDLYNLLATEYKLPSIKTISKARIKKFNVRITEPAFDFIQILAKVKASNFLRQSNWFGWDWIMENDSNYLKIIEGNYDNAKPQAQHINPALNGNYQADREKAEQRTAQLAQQE